MTDGAARPPRRPNMAHLAGWLFADLMLVLFITAFSSTVLTPRPPVPAPVKPSPSPSPSPSAPVMPRKPVLVLNPQTIPITVDGAALANGDVTGDVAQNIIDQVNSWLEANGFQNAGVGLVETFGDDPTAPNVGQAEANSINKILGGIPAFSGALTQAYWNQGDDSQAQVEVFFFES